MRARECEGSISALRRPSETLFPAVRSKVTLFSFACQGEYTKRQNVYGGGKKSGFAPERGTPERASTGENGFASTAAQYRGVERNRFSGAYNDA